MAGPTTLFQTGNHASRPAASSGCVLYWCTTHLIFYRSDGSAWANLQDLSAIGGSPTTLVIPTATSPAQTTEGSAVWDSDDDVLTVGDGSSRKTFGYLGSSTPQNLGTAAAGSSKEVSRADHVHNSSGGGGGSLSTVVQEIGADFTTASDSAWHDVTGMTGISLTAGTWIAYVDVETAHSGTFGPVFRVSDGTTIYAQAGWLLTNPGTTLSNHLHFASKPFVLGGAATMKLQVFSDTAFTVKKYPSRGGDTSVVATHITFLQIA